MKILIVSWFFPPANTIGAVRVGGLATYLLDRGHDVRVLAGRDSRFPHTLALEIVADRVIYAKRSDVNAAAIACARLVKSLLGREGKPKDDPGGQRAQLRPDQGRGNAPPPRRITDWLNRLYFDLFDWPDSQIGWLPHAWRAGRDLLKGWLPDVIFASGPPFTAFLVAHLLSRRFGIPLVVEFRDRWSDDPYYPPPVWRRQLNRWAENHVLSRAVGLVTVSEPWAQAYREKYGKPTTVIYNGFDSWSAEPDDPRPADQGSLKILYAGLIYPGRRDPSPLFKALKLLGNDMNGVRVEFYGTDESHVWPLAEKYGVSGMVSVHPRVTHAESLRLQRSADVLLLMQWNDPKEQGNVPSKLFEYLGARRPILGLGLEEGVPAAIIRQRRAGFFGNDPRAIAKQLRAWIAVKRERGGLPALPEEARAGFSRDEQFSRLEPFLARALAGKVNQPGLSRSTA